MVKWWNGFEVIFISLIDSFVDCFQLFIVL
jgi:hypothetical protein